MRTRRALSIAGAALLLIAVAVPLWPAGAGGSTTFLVPRGASMEPAVSRGDLVVVRPADEYRVGDVAAYRNRTLDRVVLHRIAAVDGDVLTFKGDANSFRDPEQVQRDDVVGAPSVRVPVVGGVLLWLASPLNMLLLVALVSLAVVQLRRRTSRATGEPAEEAAPAPRSALEDRRVVAIHDMSFPHELALVDVVNPQELFDLAERHDRPVLHDEAHGLLFVVEPTMLFRCRLGQTAEAPTLAAVHDLPVPAEPQLWPRDCPRRPEPVRRRRRTG